MGIRTAPPHAHVSLIGTTVLHAFTHAYATMFGPLYLVMRNDLALSAVSQVTLLVTVYGLMYWALAYPVGVLADRFDRRLLLGIGLLGNAACILAMGLCSDYPLLVVFSILAGAFGSAFHPCANALIPAHYPKAPGMAIGLLGIGSGIGFFAGPFYAGWSAQHSTFGGDYLSAWQRPCVELGLAGLLAGVLYLYFTREPDPDSRHRLFSRVPHPAGTHRTVLPAPLRRKTFWHAWAIALREFTSVGSVTLTALYLLKAQNFDTQRTGQALGLAMLGAAFVNPVTVYLTSGARRLPAHVAILILSAGVTASIPFFPPGAVLPVLIVLMTLLLASSAVGDAALTERIDPHFRGRINGIFLTIVGTSAAFSPFVAGYAVDRLGASAATPAAYVPLYAVLALLVLAATCSAFTLTRLEQSEPLTIEGGTLAAPTPVDSMRPIADT
jgi:MFS family permease